jgi:5-methyltetrahydrofolate--homocysteine methyltransferase
MGTELQKVGLNVGEPPESFNIEKSETVKKIHESYLRAGAKLILTNTFGANERKLKRYDAGEAIRRAVDAAKAAAGGDGFGAYVGLNVGPIGELLEPMGTLGFEDAYELFKKQMLIGEESGADVICIETMTDLNEARCAVLAAKENTNLPVYCTMSFEGGGRTFTGTGIPSMALTLTGLGVDMIGINCSVGPDEMYAMIKELIKWTHLPISVKPNAGLPHIVNGRTVYDVAAADFAEKMEKIIGLGISAVGGCCGTSPEFIGKLAEAVKGRKPPNRETIGLSAVCSPSNVVVFDRLRIVGERINPTGKPELENAVRDEDYDYIVDEALEQVDEGSDILDVNVFVTGVDEAETMRETVKAIQSVVSAPLQLDSKDYDALEAGLRVYNGKAVVNSVTGEDGALAKILPLAKKYGAAVIGLTMDEKGIPETAAGRFGIAEKIVAAALAHGIPKDDVFIDCLTLPSGSKQGSAVQTLDAVRLVKQRLGVKTVLGISNVSHGMPARAKLNRAFLALALANGLDLAIINTGGRGMVDLVYCCRQLMGMDEDSREYIERFR